MIRSIYLPGHRSKEYTWRPCDGYHRHFLCWDWPTPGYWSTFNSQQSTVQCLLQSWLVLYFQLLLFGEHCFLCDQANEIDYLFLVIDFTSLSPACACLAQFSRNKVHEGDLKRHHFYLFSWILRPYFFLFLGLRIYFFEKRVGRSDYKNKYNWKYFGVGRSKNKIVRVLRWFYRFILLSLHIFIARNYIIISGAWEKTSRRIRVNLRIILLCPN